MTRITAESVPLQDAILAERPDLRGQPIKSHSSGFGALVISIGKEVFKAATSMETFSKLGAEVWILRKMRGHGLPVPRVTYLGKRAPFFGMTRLPGVELRSFGDGMIDKWKRNRLACELADALIKIAKIFPRNDGYTYFSHNDLHGGNVLVDPKTLRLTGIIDFEGLGVYRKTTARPLGAPDEALRLAFKEAFGRRLHKEYTGQPLHYAPSRA